MLEHVDKLAETSATAISNIKFDKVTVWDGGGGGGGGNSSTSDFIRSLTHSLPPAMEVIEKVKRPAKPNKKLIRLRCIELEESC